MIVQYLFVGIYKQKRVLLRKIFHQVFVFPITFPKEAFDAVALRCLFKTFLWGRNSNEVVWGIFFQRKIDHPKGKSPMRLSLGEYLCD